MQQLVDARTKTFQIATGLNARLAFTYADGVGVECSAYDIRTVANSI
jgi:hypothetical protein